MASAEPLVPSIRYTRAESRRVTWALVVSLLVHLLGWGGYELGKREDWWRLTRWPTWTQRLVQKMEPPPPALHPPPPEMALSFVNVSQPSPDAPKQARYYSDKNSRAANRKQLREENQPDIEGHQSDAPMTEDVTRPVLTKNQPAPKPVAKPSQELQPAPEVRASQETASTGQQAGDLTMGKPSPESQAHDNSPQSRPRPRSLKEALAQQARQMPSRAMTMPGGVHRIAMTASFDAKATPFGEYDRALVDAVTGHWYQLLDSRQFAQDRTGKVSVHFRLKYDGTVTELRIDGNSVGELLGQVCVDAIEEAGPFAPWPADMRAMVGDNFRDITFTFDYY